MIPAEVEQARIRACYQPIVDLETQDIWGYEVLGRYFSNNHLQTLGPVFQKSTDDALDVAHLISIDNAIQEIAISHLKESGKKTRLFINIMPSLLARQYSNTDIRSDRFHIINLIHKYDINPELIVIEITEDQFADDITRLVHIVELYKKAGFKIAVDDVGAGMSDLSRIAYIHPDIIKVDLQLLRHSMNNKSFRQVLQGVAFMSYRLGASLLFEGIEQEEELLVALKMGSRYLQGFLFSPATENFLDRTIYRSLVREKLHDFSVFRMAELIHNYQNRDALIGDVIKATRSLDICKKETINAEMLVSLSKMPKAAQSLVLYDQLGYQISATFQRDKQGNWKRNDAKINTNRFWDPLFIQARAMKEYSGKPWNVSEPFYEMGDDSPRINVALMMDLDAILIVEMLWDI